MLAFFLLPLLGAAMAGAPYLSPAGVSYSSYSTAYGPLAYKALAASSYAASPYAVSSYAAAPLATTSYAAAPIAATSYAAAPLAATPLAATHLSYAAAPLTATVAAPASVAVPVTKIRAQPAVVQNVVDVAQPKVATRRFEIRRPAIQKQFYDIEERVVVRPAGSAVVELDTPISTNQRGQTKISPAAPVAQPALRYTGSHAIQGFHFASPVYSSYIPQHYIPQHYFPQHSFPFPPSPPVNESPEEIEQIPEQPQQTPQQPQQIQPQPLPQPAQPFPQQPQPEFDNSDSVSIENPEFSRSGNQQQGLDIQTPLFRSQLPQQPQPTPPARTQLQQVSEQLFERFQDQQFQLQRNQPEQIQRTQSEQLQQDQRSEVTQLSRSQSLQLPSGFPFQTDGQSEISFIRSQRPLLTPRPDVSPRQGPTGPTSQPATRINAEAESRGFFEGDVIPSGRNLSPEQSNLNQARLIELLTARGPVSELRSSGEPVRARVISATPAPPNAASSDEQVNTRRVVVNRPIQTVQEVEVVEPFTKIERVAVHQPAVVKTAHVELAHVPATVHAAVPAVTAIPAAVTPVPFSAHYLH